MGQLRYCVKLSPTGASCRPHTRRAHLEARQQRTMARYAGGGGRRSRGGAGGRPQLNTRFLEEEDGIEVGSQGGGWH